MHYGLLEKDFDLRGGAMKFAIAIHGTRGDVEPAAAVARELVRRGHEVVMAAPPNLVAFTQSVGLSQVASFGPDSQQQMQSEVIRNWYKLRNPLKALRQIREFVTDGWAEMSDTLFKLSDGADLILCGTTYQELAANVAEAQGIPLAALHYFPARANSQLLPVHLPLIFVQPIWAAVEWLHWKLLKPAYDEQRQTLRLADSKIRAIRRIIEHGALEIQAYDKLFFPGLDKQWQGKRPLLGSMTLELATDADESTLSWIANGRPPIYFGFGSMPIDHPSETMAMAIRVCRELGERVLICSGVLTLDSISSSADVRIVSSVSHAKIFPRCRAIVHHGGAGTTAASVRAGVPTLVLWVGAEQPIWAAQIRRMGIGTSRRFSKTTFESLRDDLQTTLGAQCTTKARELASQMTPPNQSLAAAADLLESHASHHAQGRSTGQAMQLIP